MKSRHILLLAFALVSIVASSSIIAGVKLSTPQTTEEERLHSAQENLRLKKERMESLKEDIKKTAQRAVNLETIAEEGKLETMAKLWAVAETSKARLDTSKLRVSWAVAQREYLEAKEDLLRIQQLNE
ncbi:hypothetical protein E3J61_00535 [Candidatus Dependentiae bacterium]|nr:MAG: hypothetical protein E3J61_00535 [Candidatus Dependentiae bacterium]